MNEMSPSLLGNRGITLEQLRAFVAVAGQGGFQQAGRDLLRTQSAVTQSLRKLEESLDCRLIERRQGRVIGMTAEGQRFLLAAQDILARVTDAIAFVSKPELCGRIVLGVPDDFRIAQLNALIARCLDLNPQLRIAVIADLSNRLSALLDSSDVDIAILKRIDLPPADTATGRETVSRVLQTESLHWVASKRLTFDDLSEVPLVCFPAGCIYRNAALSVLESSLKSSFLAYVSASYENIRSAVSAGLGVGILPRSAVGPDHVVLSSNDGFPILPQVHLTLVFREQRAVSRQFAEILYGALPLALSHIHA